jgi:hypothetical protein
MMRLGASLLAAALLASGCGGSKSRMDAPVEGEEPGASREAALKLPAYPKSGDLLPFKVQPQTALEYFVDRSSVSVYNDGIDAIVRFTVVARSAQAENVSYEGFRCIERERKVYAHGRKDGTWLPVKDSGWLPLGPRETAGFRYELFWNYFCPKRRAIASARQGVDALRLGGHPDSLQDGTMSY